MKVVHRRLDRPPLKMYPLRTVRCRLVTVRDEEWRADGKGIFGKGQCSETSKGLIKRELTGGHTARYVHAPYKFRNSLSLCRCVDAVHISRSPFSDIDWFALYPFSVYHCRWNDLSNPHSPHTHIQVLHRSYTLTSMCLAKKAAHPLGCWADSETNPRLLKSTMDEGTKVSPASLKTW